MPDLSGCTVKPTGEQWSQIRRDIGVLANQTYPEEACGFIFISDLNHPDDSLYVIACPNIDDWPYARFRIADRDTKWALDTGRCIGVWHSHPSDPAVPSEMDEEQAVAGVYFVIYAVADEDLAVFLLSDEGKLVPEVIVMPA